MQDTQVHIPGYQVQTVQTAPTDPEVEEWVGLWKGHKTTLLLSL